MEHEVNATCGENQGIIFTVIEFLSWVKLLCNKTPPFNNNAIKKWRWIVFSSKTFWNSFLTLWYHIWSHQGVLTFGNLSGIIILRIIGFLAEKFPEIFQKCSQNSWNIPNWHNPLGGTLILSPWLACELTVSSNISKNKSSTWKRNSRSESC